MSGKHGDKNACKILVGKFESKRETARKHAVKGKRKGCVRVWNGFMRLWIMANLRIMTHSAYEHQKIFNPRV
jgi:hypothetical protein